MNCPKCGLTQTSKNVTRHLKTHNLSNEEVANYKALMKSRPAKQVTASEQPRKIQSCPFCSKIVIVIGLIYFN